MIVLYATLRAVKSSIFAGQMSINLSFYLILFFVLATVIQLGYWIYFLIAFLKQRTRPYKEPESVKKGMSVIIAARNEVDHLKKLIPALLQQDYEHFEVIICNDRSTDETDQLLRGYSSADHRLRYITVEQLPGHMNGKKYALTLGIRAAKNDYLILTDADCLPCSKLWIRSMASGFRQNKAIVLGYSDYKARPGFLNYFIRFETLITGLQYLSKGLLGRPFMGVGRNLAYKKSLFIENKGFIGFNDLTGGDDDLFVQRHAAHKNTEVVIGKESVTLSTPMNSIRSYIQQKIRHLAVGRFYAPFARIYTGIFAMTWEIIWGLGLVLLLTPTEPLLVIALFLIRWLIMAGTIFVATQQIGIAFNIGGIILLDLLFPIYYIFVGTVALVSKKVKWK